jgi:hypothetical protein
MLHFCQSITLLQKLVMVLSMIHARCIMFIKRGRQHQGGQIHQNNHADHVDGEILGEISFQDTHQVTSPKKALKECAERQQQNIN